MIINNLNRNVLTKMPEHVLDTIVIGGGQAGLAMGQQLAEQGRDFTIVDAAPQTGHVWRSRWDSLRLFTPAQYDSLPGYAFPGEHNYLPTKDEVADYLVDYANKFDLPIQFNYRVNKVKRVRDAFEVNDMVARNVVVATGPFNKPRIPAFAHKLQVPQMHSSEYRNAQQFAPGSRVMVVGAANSGVKVAAELATSHDVTLAVSRNLPALPEFAMGKTVFWWLSQIGFFNASAETHLGKHYRKREILIGSSINSITSTHRIHRVGRAVDADANGIVTTTGRVEVDAVVWASGFQPDFGFIDAPIFNDAGRPKQTRGVTEVPGLYFLGLPWMHTRGSALLGWVGNDAAYLSQHIKNNREN